MGDNENREYAGHRFKKGEGKREILTDIQRRMDEIEGFLKANRMFEVLDDYHYLVKTVQILENKAIQFMHQSQDSMRYQVIREEEMRKYLGLEKYNETVRAVNVAIKERFEKDTGKKPEGDGEVGENPGPG